MERNTGKKKKTGILPLPVGNIHNPRGELDIIVKQISGSKVGAHHLTVCCPASTPTKAPQWPMAVGSKVASSTWRLGGRGLRSFPTVIFSLPNPEEQEESMGE